MIGTGVGSDDGGAWDRATVYVCEGATRIFTRVASEPDSEKASNIVYSIQYSFVQIKDGSYVTSLPEHVLATTQTLGEARKKWFQGTTDVVRQFIWGFKDAKNKDVEDILILYGDHLYRMDYMDFIKLSSKQTLYRKD
ncbi:glucose-1-phosphate adenylyltransferase [Vigna unguiculata]|uniref:glucose-1-phosphate adenylyltransferase n=1 Tax=Vigna unguiculata TaxID=3917 RepID=A0A4D6MUN0_VIGUN|nr:glucose-1-phosphate adenylyltransferase [Vigna unguiculata]